MIYKKRILEGQPASPYCEMGVVAKSNEACIKWSKKVKMVLVKDFLTPEDSIAIDHCVGIVTLRGGMSSHAAIVARELKKACVINCGDIDCLEDGEIITVDGINGTVCLEHI